MRILFSLVLGSLCVGCAGREVNPDAARSQLAYPAQCPWSTEPSTMAQDDCLLEPQRAFPRQDQRGMRLPAASSKPLEGLPR